MKQEQRGFTLIELVMVIVILGILAAVALPKFVDLSADARKAAIQGAAGALSSASAINYAAAQVGNGGSTALGSSAGAALIGKMAGWNATDFSVSGEANCAGAGAGSTASVTLSHTGGGPTTSATIICTS